MFHQRTKCIHGCNTITTRCFHIIIANFYIFMTVFQEDFLIQFCSLELLMRISVSDSNSPTAHLIHKASLNRDIFITGNSCNIFMLRTKCRHIDPTIIHVLIVHITIHIMDQQIAKCDSMPYSFILCHNSNTGTVHFISKGIILSDNLIRFICDLQIFYNNIFCVIQ